MARVAGSAADLCSICSMHSVFESVILLVVAYTDAQGDYIVIPCLLQMDCCLPHLPFRTE